MAASEPNKIWGVSKDILTLAIVPLAGWVIKIEVGNAQRDVQIQNLGVSAARVQELDTRVQQNAILMARMEEKLDAANRRLDGIHDEIRNLNRDNHGGNNPK
jgi:hypothetical protein